MIAIIATNIYDILFSDFLLFKTPKLHPVMLPS